MVPTARFIGTALVTGVLAWSAITPVLAEVPKRLVFTSYDFGSSGFAQASGIANALKQTFGTRVRIIPSGTSIGRILPLTQRKVQTRKAIEKPAVA